MKRFGDRVKATYQRWASKARKATGKKSKRKKREVPACDRKKFYRIEIVGPWIMLPDGTEAALDRNGYYRNRDRRLIHREIYQNAYGCIPAEWVVHHVNHKKTDNSRENLIALPQWFHWIVHKNSSRKTYWNRQEILSQFKKLLESSKHKISPDGEMHLLEMAVLVAAERVAASSSQTISPSPPKTILRKKSLHKIE